MKFGTSSALLLLPALLSTQVSAHGYVHDITVNGARRYTGSELIQGFRSPGKSIIRQVEDNGPIKDFTSSDLICGRNARIASDVADVNPGDELALNWGASWPHKVGPMISWMASCGDTPCNNFDARNAQWFKIAQVAQRPSQGDWVQADISAGLPALAKIPANIAPGNYLLRYEIIALHLGTERNGAEIYPSCAQLRVGGSGTGHPAANELFAIPGVYQTDMKGLYEPGLNEPGFKYVIPGPAVASLAGGSGGAPANPAPSHPVPAKPTPVPSSSSAKPSPTDKEVIPSVGGPVNAAPLPSVSTSSSVASSVSASVSSTSIPLAVPSSRPRRCKKRPTAKERREKAAAQANAAPGSPATSTSSGSASPSDGAKLLEVDPAEIPAPLNLGKRFGRHSRVMRRLAGVHSH